MVVKKATKGRPKSEIYDTSVVHAKFRVARIEFERDLFFDHYRELNFDQNRDIDARITGVVFRMAAAVGFRNVGVSNLDEVRNPEEWPDMGKARPGETQESNRDQIWYDKWGKSSGAKKRTKSPVKGKSRTSPTPVTPLPGTTREGAKERAHSFNQYAVSLVQRGDYHAANMYFQKAVELDPGNSVYFENVKRCREWIDELDGR